MDLENFELGRGSERLNGETHCERHLLIFGWDCLHKYQFLILSSQGLR